MKTILVDGSQTDLERLVKECERFPEVELCGAFINPLEALEYGELHKIDFAMLSIVMPSMTGIELAEKLRQQHPGIILIFVTAYPEYALKALAIKADYFVVKPYSSFDIADAVRRASLLSRGQQKHVFVRAFGRFDIFVDDKLVKFTNAKSKELLALCVDHFGGSVTMEEAIDKLWEDHDYDSRAKALYRKALISASATLKEYGVENIFIKMRGYCYIDKGLIECDYYEYLSYPGKTDYYPDEYMFEYGWSELTHAKLSYEKDFGKDYS